jgi:hypothetical protein
LDYVCAVAALVRGADCVALFPRAATRALGHVLAWARDVDVDARVRAAARLASAGQELAPSAVGSEVAWLWIPDGPVPAWLLLTGSGAPSLPVPTAGQRVVPVLGVQSAAPGVRLAPAGAAGDDARRDSRKEDGS